MGSQSQGDDGLPSGPQTPNSTYGDYNNHAFAILQMLGKLQTATVVRVVACSNAGDTSPVGTVDILPLVNQVDALGQPTEHTTIFNVPYLRVQGGANAIIIDPEVGDLGIAVFASRDISKIKTTKDQGNPGSARQFSWSDAMYIGGILNGVPTQFIQFNEDGITVTTPVDLVLNVGGDLTANVTGDMSAMVGGDVDITASGSATVTGNEATVDGGGGSINGVVQGTCVCAFTGAPHAMISGTFKGSM